MPSAPPHFKGDLYGKELASYIEEKAKLIGLDPLIPLSIAPHEGGFQGSAGDYRAGRPTSFGPFQLHRGGELPSGLTDAQALRWANSPAGVDYALSGMRQAIITHGGKPGVQPGPGVPLSLWDAVKFYERPKNAEAKWQQAGHTYARLQRDRGSVVAALTELGILGAVLGGAAATGAGAAAGTAGAGRAASRGAAKGAASGSSRSTLEKALGVAGAAVLLDVFWPYAQRAAEILAGAVLILLGLLMLGRAATPASAARQVAGAVT